MFFAFDSDTTSSPYDSLSNLCTILVIAEEASDVPLQPLFHTINGALQKGKGDGDVLVMAARALGLLLDKFSRCISCSEKDRSSKMVKNCFEMVFSLVKKREVTLQHEKTTVRELKEELLNCLSLAGNCSGILSVVPSTEEQLKFCFNALDGSKWTSCKVLQYCIGLIRRGELRNTGDHKVVEELLHHHLSSLCHLDIDREWDELLRIVVEGIITYRVWRERCINNTLQEVGRKRQRREEDKIMTQNENTFSNETSMKSMETSLIAIGERIFTSGSSESRLQFTLACLASVMETSSSSTLERNKKEFEWLCKLLQHSAARSAGYSSPFSHTREMTTKREQLWADTFQALPNLQWIVPPLVWSALIVLAKLCGANFGFRKEYMWAWRGEGGEYYPYSRTIRQQLTSMFFSAQTSKKVLQNRHMFDIGSMTDTSPLTLVVSRIHFQPIPSILTFDEKLVMPVETLHFNEEISSLIQETLRSLSFGHTPIATLARAIRLYVICSDVPIKREEGVVTAFRSLHAEQKRPVVEDISAILLQRDKRWAPILLEAGIADALTELPVSTAANKSKCTITTPHGSPPLVELIRSAGTSPKLAPIKLPDLVDFSRFLQHASSEEMLSFIEGLEHTTLSETALLETCAKINKDSEMIRRMRSAAHTYILRILHQTSIAQQEGKSLVDRVCGASDVISICAPEKNTDKCARCPKGHPLRIHFSINWRCNLCNSSNAFGSLACRECDYDLCSDCSNAKLSQMDVSMTAVVGDIIRGWRECRTKEQVKENSSIEKVKHTILFTAKGILPSSFPAFTLRDEEIHFAEVNERCECDVLVPFSIANIIEHVPSYNPLKVFLHTFDALEQWNDIEPAIVDVLESCGSDIFERGITGIPLPVIHVLQTIAPYISLSFKRDTAHFLAVGCRRFGLYHLQDVNARVRGMIVGDISSNGLATKVSVKRETDSITQTLFNTFIQYPTLRNKVEFNFEGEEGTGEGPTQELYAEVSRRYRDMTKLWHERDDGVFVAFPTLKQVYREEFFVLGACCGRAFVDGYTMDFDILPIAWLFIRTRSCSAESYWRLLSELEPALTNSYNHLLNCTDAELADMGIEQDESGTPLTTSTVKAYVHRCVEEHLTHALANLRWFSLGLCAVVDPRAFLLLTDEEMSVVLCGSSGPDGPEGESESDGRLFGEAALRAVLVEAHGYAAGAREVRMLAAIVGGEFTRAQQRLFLEFLTGSPRLPLNGLAGLGRKITVVRKELEGHGEQTLPSCNTCFLYFKLPPYSTHDIMKTRLLTAVTEGRRNFSLS